MQNPSRSKVAIDGVTPRHYIKSPLTSRHRKSQQSISVSLANSACFGDVIDVSRPLQVAKSHESRLVFYSKLSPRIASGNSPRRTRLKHAVSNERLSRFTFAHDLANGIQQNTEITDEVGTLEQLRKSYRHRKTSRKIKRLKTGRMLSKRI